MEDLHARIFGSDDDSDDDSGAPQVATTSDERVKQLLSASEAPARKRKKRKLVRAGDAGTSGAAEPLEGGAAAGGGDDDDGDDDGGGGELEAVEEGSRNDMDRILQGLQGRRKTTARSREDVEAEVQVRARALVAGCRRANAHPIPGLPRRISSSGWSRPPTRTTPLARPTSPRRPSARCACVCARAPAPRPSRVGRSGRELRTAPRRAARRRGGTVARRWRSLRRWGPTCASGTCTTSCSTRSS
jgi:hypothetical protein